MDLEIQINIRKFFFSSRAVPAVQRRPCVYLDYGKINIMESQGNGGASCAVTAWSRIRAPLDVIEKRHTMLPTNKLMRKATENIGFIQTYDIITIFIIIIIIKIKEVCLFSGWIKWWSAKTLKPLTVAFNGHLFAMPYAAEKPSSW